MVGTMLGNLPMARGRTQIISKKSLILESMT